MKFVIAIILFCVAVGSIRSEEDACDSFVCGMAYNPICARRVTMGPLKLVAYLNFKTFPSECDMRSANCINGGKLIEVD